MYHYQTGLSEYILVHFHPFSYISYNYSHSFVQSDSFLNNFVHFRIFSYIFVRFCTFLFGYGLDKWYVQVVVPIDYCSKRCDNGWCRFECRSPAWTNCPTKKSRSKNFQKFWLYCSRLYSRPGIHDPKPTGPSQNLREPDRNLLGPDQDQKLGKSWTNSVRSVRWSVDPYSR